MAENYQRDEETSSNGDYENRTVQEKRTTANPEPAPMHENYPTGEHRDSTVYSDSTSAMSPRGTATYIVTVIAWILEILLALRFLFLLFGANAANGFVNFIYGITGMFVAPFRGTFATPGGAGIGVFSWDTLLAMVVYALIAWAIVAIISAYRRSAVRSEQYQHCVGPDCPPQAAR